MVFTRPSAGHRACVIALESFAFPAPPFEDLAFIDEGKIAVSAANAIGIIMDLSIVQSP
jgi:hypothetical protein